MMQVVIQPSKSKAKKMDAIIDGKKTVHFGQKGASDFTLHKNPEQRKLYINRHKKNERWDDPTTAGFYAKHCCGTNQPLKNQLMNLNKRYKNINFILRK
jgi:hypothetical protein